MALHLVHMFFEGFVLLQLWGWFIEPLGVPVIGLVHAMGMCVVVRMLQLPEYKVLDILRREKADDREEVLVPIALIITKFMFLIIGWFVSLWMPV